MYPGEHLERTLRRALNQLAASLDWLYMDSLQPLFMDPWELRHQFIQVRLGEVSLKDLVIRLTGGWTEKADRNLDRLRLLLDAQFERQRMFTSCGWYFDDFDRIEAVWLVRQATGKDLTDQALSALKFVHSTRTGLRGDTVFLEKLDKAKEKYG